MMPNYDKNRCLDTDSQRKRARLTGCAFILALWLGIGGPIDALKADFSAIVWRDLTTGFALSGYDPVSYFSPGGPTLGVEEYEYAKGGVVWRFANEGNLKAFRLDPEIYTPQFGGYGAFGMSRGVTTDPNPEIWQIKRGKLYLFHSGTAKKSWLKGAKALNKKASEYWRLYRVKFAPG